MVLLQSAARLDRRAGRLAEARLLLRRALAVEPCNAAVLMELAMTEDAAGNAAAAEEVREQLAAAASRAVAPELAAQRQAREGLRRQQAPKQQQAQQGHQAQSGQQGQPGQQAQQGQQAQTGQQAQQKGKRGAGEARASGAQGRWQQKRSSGRSRRQRGSPDQPGGGWAEVGSAGFDGAVWRVSKPL